MWEDKIVKEVRQTRLEIEEEAHHDLEELYMQALKIQSEVKSRLVSKPLPRLAVTSSDRS